MSHDDYSALGGQPLSNGFDVEKLSALIDKTEATGLVSREDVEPYINSFPPTVALEDFDEQPSKRGYDMALEGFASFLKVGLAVAVVGAIGFLVWHLISSRKKGDKLNGDAIQYQALFNALIEQENFIAVSALNGTGMVSKESGFEGQNLSNYLSTILGSSGVLRSELEVQGSRHIAYCMYNGDPSVLRMFSEHVEPEKASQKTAIDRLGVCLKGSTSKISGGKQNEVIAELKSIRDLVERLSLGGVLQSTFASRIPSVVAAPGEHGSTYALSVVDAIETFFEGRETSSRTMTDELFYDITQFKGAARIRAQKLEPSVSRFSFEAITKACTEANKACEKMRKDAETTELSTLVESEFEETLRTIQNNVKVTEKLLDLAVIEATSLHRYMLFLSKVAKHTQEFGTGIAKEAGEGSIVKELGKRSEDIKKALKAIK